MKTIAAAVLAAIVVAVPAAASASCTWSQTGNLATGTCTTASESAPTLGTEGLDLSTCGKGVLITLAADSTRTLSGTGTVKIYVWTAAGAWAEVPDLAQSVTSSSVRYQSFPGLFLAVGNRGRIAAVPSSVGVSAGGSTIYLQCQ